MDVLGMHIHLNFLHIIYGNFDIMKWLKDNGCPWNEHTFACAVEYCNSDIIKWLKSNGFFYLI